MQTFDMAQMSKKTVQRLYKLLQEDLVTAAAEYRCRCGCEFTRPVVIVKGHALMPDCPHCPNKAHAASPWQVMVPDKLADWLVELHEAGKANTLKAAKVTATVNV